QLVYIVPDRRPTGQATNNGHRYREIGPPVSKRHRDTHIVCFRLSGNCGLRQKVAGRCEKTELAHDRKDLRRALSICVLEGAAARAPALRPGGATSQSRQSFCPERSPACAASAGGGRGRWG